MIDNFEEMIKAFREDRSALIREVKSLRAEVDELKAENSKLVNIIISKKGGNSVNRKNLL